MKIESWIIDGINRLIGITPDGRHLTSTEIVSKAACHVTTFSGSVYELGTHSTNHGPTAEMDSIRRLHAIPYEQQS